MTEKKLIELAKMYLKIALTPPTDPPTPKRADPTKALGSLTHSEADRHIAWMCEHIIKTAGQDPMRMQRWLGFIQGYFCTTGRFTINELRFHNPEEMSIP
jgi:hypothetical protein